MVINLKTALAILSLLPVAADAETKRPELVFASAKEGAQILTTRDDFVTRLSAFDRSARMKTAKEVSERDYLDFVAANVLGWTDAEQVKLQAAMDGVRAKMEPLGLPFSESVHVVKTTGKEEGNAAYTRGDAVVFPARELQAPMVDIQKKLCHELFHILSRKNPRLREKLYESIGFVKCSEIDFPEALKARKITNPDAPRNDHSIKVQVKGQNRWAVPILYSSSERYDEAKGGDFFDYLRFELLLLDEQSPGANGTPAYDSKNPALVSVNGVTGFFEKVGRNTPYIIHPEEILAENFTILILGSNKTPSPEIISKMRSILAEEVNK
jgi:hypothetical protein